MYPRGRLKCVVLLSVIDESRARCVAVFVAVFVERQEDTREVKTVVPVTSFRLALWNFAREYRSLRRTFRFGQFKDTWIAGPFSLIDRFLET